MKEEMMIAAEIISDTKNVMEDCGLGQIQNAIESMDAVYVGGMTACFISPRTFRGFDAGCLSRPMRVSPTPFFVKDARNNVSENVAAVYSNIDELVKSEKKGGYENDYFLTHDPSQIKSMLSSY